MRLVRRAGSALKALLQDMFPRLEEPQYVYRGRRPLMATGEADIPERDQRLVAPQPDFAASLQSSASVLVPDFEG